MPFFHLCSPAGSVWPPLPPAAVSQVWAAYQSLDRTQWLKPAELEELQFQQLRALLRHCWQQVPYYRRVMGEAGLDGGELQAPDDLRRLPLLTRELYQRNFADLQARSLPPGMKPAFDGYTSGTSGVPIQVLKTNHDALWWNALYLRDHEWSGLDPRGRLASIRLLAKSADELPRALAGIALPHWSQLCAALVECGPSFVMDVRQDPRKQLQWLRGVRPNYLLSMPSNLEFLASLLQESGQPLEELRAIQAVGEPLPTDTRQRIETGFGVPVKDLYSTTEAGYMASPCPAGHGLHVHSENMLAEVLDEHDQPCRPGQTGRLVFTTLHNFLAPFIRYDIQDDVTLAEGPCPCGRGLPLWTRVEGRRVPLLHLAEGRRKSAIGLILVVRKVGGCHQFQIVQRAVDHVVVRVVPDRTWQAGHAELVRQAVRGEMEADIRVDVEVKEVLERTAGGKVKLVMVECGSSP